MSDKINEGDYVEVWWTSSESCLKGRVVHRPQDTGDMWYIKDEKGNIRAVNPQCSNLETIVKPINLNTGREAS